MQEGRGVLARGSGITTSAFHVFKVFWFPGFTPLALTFALLISLHVFVLSFAHSISWFTGERTMVFAFESTKIHTLIFQGLPFPSYTRCLIVSFMSQKVFPTIQVQ